MRGRFITFEGGEGVGKSTQIRRLAASLNNLGVQTLMTREPGGSPHAEKLREVLLSGGAKPFGPFAETILFNAARDDHLEATIRPALAQGIWVLCDRFIDSTRAYQGVLGEIEPDLIRSMERVVVGNTMPDLTLILDLPARDGLARARARSAQADRFEAESLSFHEKLREAFLAIAEYEPKRCAVINALGTPDAVAAVILSVVRRRLAKERAST
ncbi:thymidylate kinase [Labrys miyagiensis]|uniref:Thymidylate kinase n=1 Tax=Labrys miyagiensis TaxID=346912 RepID=A0ABQ6CQ04_9HYPH|nr:dTMP kinase [Labrys miyagiensis]GLS20301.1 thymidylate kinase [Labrys miyagiensis]